MEPPRKQQCVESPTLPSELWDTILNQPGMNARVLRQVCHSWRELVNHNLQCGLCFHLRLAMCQVCGTGCCSCNAIRCTERISEQGKLWTCYRTICKTCATSDCLDDFFPCSVCGVARVCDQHERHCCYCDEYSLCWQCAVWCENCGERFCSDCARLLQCRCPLVLCPDCRAERSVSGCAANCGRDCCNTCCKSYCPQCGKIGILSKQGRLFCDQCDRGRCARCARCE